MKIKYLIVIVVLMFLIGLLTGGYYGKRLSKVVVTTDTVFSHDTIFPHIVIKWLTKPGKTIYVPSDTIILKEADTTYVYNDSIWDDKCKIFIRDEINNKGVLSSRDIGYTLYVPEKIFETKYITKTQTIFDNKRYSVAIGMGLGSKKLANCFEFYAHSNKNMYGIEYLRFYDKNIYLLKFGLKF